MRILTWNVNVLRTCLDYHPFSSMEKRNVEGLLDALGAQIACFQEHKTRRAQLDKSYACPGPYDGFWTFPRSKTGYSGVCTFVDSRLCVPLKAEEGITGLLLDDKASTMKPPWTPEERLGCYPDHDEMRYVDEEGVAFDPKRLDMEGRAVVCDFGLFILFNLYSPNETNDTRRPYKMNFLACLQERVRLLMASGREVIIVGDLNIVRAPIDSGEGGIRSSAEQHYEHPARVILNDWIAPRGPMIDVVRESWPDRDDMFTCWNQKLDARPSNYGSRIDYILCSPGLRPWIKSGDIDTKIYGSDHCPVYIDLHDSIPDPANPGDTLYLRDALNPPDRPPVTTPIYPQDPPRGAPEPPRFATKFYDEFSGKQRTLKSFFGGGGAGVKGKTEVKREKVYGKEAEGMKHGVSSKLPVGDEAQQAAADAPSSTPIVPKVDNPSPAQATPATPFGIARAAFAYLDNPMPARTPNQASPSRTPSLQHQRSQSLRQQSSSTVAKQQAGSGDDDDDIQYMPSAPIKPALSPRVSNGSSSHRSVGSNKRQKTSNVGASQQSIASFFGAPKAKSNGTSNAAARPARDRSTSSTVHRSASREPPDTLPPPLSPPIHRSHPSPSAVPASARTRAQSSEPPDAEADAAVAAALAAAEAEEEASREAKKAEQAPIWNNLFAKKAAPLCIVHRKPCKVFTSKVVGPNKNKRFWLCSL